MTTKSRSDFLASAYTLRFGDMRVTVTPTGQRTSYTGKDLCRVTCSCGSVIHERVSDPDRWAKSHFDNHHGSAAE